MEVKASFPHLFAEDADYRTQCYYCGRVEDDELHEHKHHVWIKVENKPKFKPGTADYYCRCGAEK